MPFEGLARNRVLKAVKIGRTHLHPWEVEIQRCGLLPNYFGHLLLLLFPKYYYLLAVSPVENDSIFIQNKCGLCMATESILVFGIIGLLVSGFSKRLSEEVSISSRWCWSWRDVTKSSATEIHVAWTVRLHMCLVVNCSDRSSTQ